MLENDAETVLPWVPDIVGKEAEGDRAVLIFGAAYAGFIQEYSCRGACLRLRDYAEAANWTEFQRLFLDNVVAPDAAYYRKLESLLNLAGVSANRIILSDLCPNSIVKRSAVINKRRQDDSRQPGNDRASVFCSYVENPAVECWTWRRITESRVERIIALGHVAEHGLLRLFSRNHARIFCNRQPFQPRLRATCDWVDRYADPGKNLGYWLNPGRWWTISIPGRDVRLLPVYHPAAVDQYDPGYRRTGSALAVWLPK